MHQNAPVKSFSSGYLHYIITQQGRRIHVAYSFGTHSLFYPAAYAFTNPAWRNESGGRRESNPFNSY